MTRGVDILLLGATGFTGRLIARYLSEHPDFVCRPAKFTLSLAARSRDKLDTLALELGLNDTNTAPRLVLDISDVQQVEGAVRDVGVVINACGPFWKYSKVVVQTCARLGIHYVDIGGEVPWMDYIVNECDALARTSGAVLVTACAHDSIPADYGVYLANKTLKSTHPSRGIESSTSAFDIAGEFSGGTIATILMTFTGDVPRDINIRTEKDFAMSPIKGLPQPRPRLTYKLPHTKTPLVGGYYLMAFIDKHTVQRSWGLAQQAASADRDPGAAARAYGETFTYDEFMVMPSTLAGVLLSLVIYILALLSTYPLTNRLLQRIFPQPGSGPSESVRQNGHLKVTNISVSTPDPTTGTRAVVRTVIEGRGDGGYLLTSGMVSESALAVLFDRAKLPPLGRYGGALTPSTAFGDVLLQRLEANGRWRFESRIIDEKLI